MQKTDSLIDDDAITRDDPANHAGHTSVCLSQSSETLFNRHVKQSDTGGIMSTFLQGLINNEHFVGITILIKEADKTLLKKSYGSAKLEENKPADVDALYRIASATKPFIATLVIKSAMGGKILLDEKLSTYLDEQTLEGIENADNVTIRQLLAMQSGIFNYTDNPDFEKFIDENPTHTWTAQGALAFAKGMKAEFQPGEATDYCNTNYILLGLVLEQVYQQSLGDILDNQILKPLALTNTYFEGQHFIPNPTVPGYVYEDDQFEDVSNVNSGRGLADGGIVSNVEDLTCFIQHIMTDDDFLPPQWRDEMLTFHPMKECDGEEYGLGWMRFPSEHEVVIGHDGSDTGYQSWMIYLPKRQTSLVFLSNTNPPALDQTALLNALESGLLAPVSNSGLENR